MSNENQPDWSKIAAGYDQIASEIWESPSLYKDALKLAPDCRGSIIDVGCGQGLFLDLIGKTFPKVTSLSGCDLSPKLVELSRARVKNADIKVANALELTQYETSSFDFLFMIGSLEHMIYHETALRTAYRVLKPNGVICVAVPNRNWINYQKWLKNRTEFQPVDDYWFQPQELTGLMEHVGFKIESIRGLWALYRGNWIHNIEIALAAIFPSLNKRMKLIGVRARK